jgi:hypothetical protein
MEPGHRSHTGSASLLVGTGMRRGQPVGALATSSDGGGVVADPVAARPV